MRYDESKLLRLPPSKDGPPAAEELSELSRIASRSGSFDAADAIKRALEVSKETLDMDLAFVSEFIEGRMMFRALEGDADSFGWREGQGIPVENTFCRRLLDGELPNVIPDAKSDERVRCLEVTSEADIGSYIGVPLRFSDGRLYGTLCCLSHSPNPSLRERDAQFMHVLGRLVSEQLEREELESENRRLEVRATGAGALLAALEARDGYTGEHSKAVVEFSVSVARRMGLTEKEVEDVEQAALLHDVGKMGVPDAILNKQGPLDEDEWEAMREHPKIGEQIVSSVEGLAHLAPVVRAEHERWDGGGYPDGLSEERVPLPSRIVFACDAYHAMISDRPYRKALGVPAAIEELRKNAGTQFCPHTVGALLDIVDPTGPR